MTMMLTQAILLLLSVTLTMGQRGSFAGNRPIGFPVVETTTDALGNRFGDGGTTSPLPLEALGDKDLVDRVNKLPADNKPFWVLNAQALEANRKKPQVYPQRPNSFIDPPIPEPVTPGSQTTKKTTGLSGSTGSLGPNKTTS